MIAAIASATGLAVDNLRLRSSRPDQSEPAAAECVACRRVVEGVSPRCPHCGGDVARSQVPLTLRGTYRLIERIGAGGMGIVYRATDLLLSRDVAIKTLPAVTPKDVLRLKDEARAMAAVSHPNLAVVYGIEMWDEKPLLMVEYLPGGTLRDRLGTRLLSPIAAIDVAVTLAEVLDELHRSGIIHCDVKPSNIGFTRSGAVKLLDFGLARLIRVIDPQAATVTIGRGEMAESLVLSEHGLAGTPYYMSPEAISGAQLSPSFDVWAVAVVVYEMLTGSRPFNGRDTHQVFASVLRGEFAPIDASLCANASAIDQWLRRQLSRNAAERSPDAASLAASLRGLRTVLG
jgi:serine/threonine protein kinase